MATRVWRDVKPALSAPTLAVIEEDLKFARMSPVQSAAIPVFLAHKDVSVQAQTGFVWFGLFVCLFVVFSRGNAYLTAGPEQIT